MSLPTDAGCWAEVDLILEEFVASATFADLVRRTAEDVALWSGDVPAEAADLSAGLSLRVGIGSEPGAVVRAHGGWSGQEVVAVASASKWPAAFTILSLVDDGLLDLSSTVGQLFPGTSGAVGAITVEQLLSHRAGITPFHPALGERGWTLAQAAEVILEEPLIAEPGTDFVYGGSSTQVAARMAEIAAGANWVELFRQRVAEPLGASTLNYGAAIGNPRVPGGVLTDSASFDRVLRAHAAFGIIDGRRVLSAELVTRMETDATGDDPVTDPFGNERVGYGLGLWVDERSGDDSVCFSSPGAWGTVPWIDRRAQYRGLLMLHGLGIDGSLLGRGLVERLRPAIESVLSEHHHEGEHI